MAAAESFLPRRTPNKPKKHDITDTDEFEDDHMVGEADQVNRLTN